MTDLTKVLKGLKNEGYKTKSELDIESTVEFLGKTNVFDTRENFNLIYTNKKEFELETSWSNQLITNEWFEKVVRLRNILS